MGCPFNDISFRYSINQVPAHCSHEVELLALIVSKPENFRMRDAVRKTWLKDLKGHGGIHAFFIGQSLDKRIQSQIDYESKTFGDIIQLDLMESDSNTTPKTVALINWTNKFCPGANFVLKCDENVYVNVNNLRGKIQKLDFRNPQIFGKNVTWNEVPSRRLCNAFFKNYFLEIISVLFSLDFFFPVIGRFITYHTWPWKKMPSFLFGNIFLMTQSAVAPLLAAAQTTPYIPFDDLFLTGLSARRARLGLWSHER